MFKLYNLYNFRNLSTPEKKNSSPTPTVWGILADSLSVRRFFRKKQTKLRRNRLTIESRKMLITTWNPKQPEVPKPLFLGKMLGKYQFDPLKKNWEVSRKFRKHQPILDVLNLHPHCCCHLKPPARLAGAISSKIGSISCIG